MRHSCFARSPGKRRRGITIIEVLIAASGVALLMSLCAVSIQLLLRLNADAHGRYSAAVTLERLARQVRDDVHASVGAGIVANQKVAVKPPGLHLNFASDHVVDYASADGGVVRTESRGAKVVRHETYALPRGGAGHFEMRDEAVHKLVVLVINFAAGKSKTEPPRPVEVVALQGKDRARPPSIKGDTPR